MRNKVFLVFMLATLFVSMVSALEFVDDTEAEFDLGTYVNTFYNTVSQAVTLFGGNTTGNYTSQIFDSGGGSAIWNNISWLTQVSPVRLPDVTDASQPLPDNANETGWFNMSGNIALFHLDETTGPVVDTSGQSNNGTNMDAVRGVLGKVDNAFSFNGTTDWVTIEDTNEYRTMCDTDGCSACAWIKHDDAGTIGEIIGRYNAASATDRYWRLLKSNTDSPQFQIYDGNGGVRTAVGTTTLAANTWYHLCGVYTGNNVTGGSPKIYVDGQLENTAGSRVINSTSWAEDENITIGAIDEDAPVNHYKGLIDELSVFNRQLDPTEVEELYNGQKDLLNIGDANLSKARIIMHMDEASGDILDYAGFGNDGTYTGALYQEPGVINFSLGFDGANDHVSITKNPDLNITADENLTILAWVKSSDFSNSPIIYADTGTSKAIELEFRTNGRVRVDVDDGATSLSTADDGTILTTGTWNHIALVLNRNTDTITRYINGAPDGTPLDISTIGDLGSDATNIYLGEGSAGGNDFTGSMDEFGWTTNPLSDAEILQLYRIQVDKINVSVRSCDDAVCSGETFTNIGTTSPFSLSEPNYRYFQYFVEFNGFNQSESPTLSNLTIDYNALIDPITTLISPADDTLYEVINTTDITFIVNASNDEALVNCSLYTDTSGSWQLEQTNNVTGVTNSTTFTLYNVTEGNYIWNTLCYDNDALGDWGDINFTFSVNNTIIISNLQAEASRDSITVTWDTNIASNSTVCYGTDDTLGSCESSAAAETSHSITISGLVEDTLYYYNVTSETIVESTTEGPNTVRTARDLTTGRAIFLIGLLGFFVALAITFFFLSFKFNEEMIFLSAFFFILAIVFIVVALLYTNMVMDEFNVSSTILGVNTTVVNAIMYVFVAIGIIAIVMFMINVISVMRQASDAYARKADGDGFNSMTDSRINFNRSPY